MAQSCGGQKKPSYPVIKKSMNKVTAMSHISPWKSNLSFSWKLSNEVLYEPKPQMAQEKKVKVGTCEFTSQKLDFLYWPFLFLVPFGYAGLYSAVLHLKGPISGKLVSKGWFVAWMLVC